jgi:hypothetical protein
MNISYKGNPVYFKSQVTRKLFIKAMLFMIPMGFVQTIAASVGISYVIPLHPVLIAAILGLISIEITFIGDRVFRILPEVVRKNLFWITMPVAFWGFNQANELFSVWCVVFFTCILYRSILSFVGWVCSHPNDRLKK